MNDPALKRRLLEPCANLRSKGSYLGAARDGDADIAARMALPDHCWCVHTMTTVGPDDQLVSDEDCVSGRSCFEER